MPWAHFNRSLEIPRQPPLTARVDRAPAGR